MADYISPIINQFVTILQTNLPTEIDAIDTNLEDVPNQFYFKSFQTFVQQFPTIEVYPFGDSDVDANFTNDTVEFTWRIVTVINIHAKNEDTAQANMNKYLTAMMKTIIKGTSSNWNLDGNVDLLKPISTGFVDVGSEGGGVVKGGAIVWECLKEEDPTT